MGRNVVKGLLIAGFVFLSSQFVDAQISINQFLKSAETDYSIKLIDEQSSYLQDKPYSLSFVNRFQFRMQNNEGLNKETQRFGLWLSPENPWTIKSTNRYFKAYSSSLEVERQLALKKALAERYLLVINYLYFQELTALYQKDKNLVEAQINILEKQQSSDYFNPTAFADLKLEQISKDVQLEEVLFEIDNQTNRIDLKYTDGYVKDLVWDYRTVVSVEQIGKVLDTLKGDNAVPYVLALEQKKIELAKQSYNIQKSNINTGFIQGNYLNGNIAKDKTPWSFVAGITIPINNPNKGDMARKQLQVIEETQKKAMIESTLSEEKLIAADKLKNLIVRFNATKKKIEDLNVNALGGTLSSMRENNPLVVVKLNSNVLKIELILLKLKQSIMLSYIELLSINDQLQAQPLVNYLSPSLNDLSEK